MNALVTGGAGYIGSHCVRQLNAVGHRAVVLDNLSLGHRASLSSEVPFYQGDLGDSVLLDRIFGREKIEIVMHFAALASVGESVTEPLKYYANNLAKPIRLIEAMINRGIRKFIFSSTCATYGIPKTLPITEKTPRKPINPYGQTKLDMEKLLEAVACAYGLSFAAFRYFNAAGAAPDGSIGEDHEPEFSLVPLAIQSALGIRKELTIFGSDYPTPDGSCLRDYIHVDDLCVAHIAAFDKLDSDGQALYYNLGTGRPHSVHEVIASVERISGRPVPTVVGPRRPGDPPALYADPSKAQRELHWMARYQELDSIVETAWNWHRRNPTGFNDRPEAISR